MLAPVESSDLPLVFFEEAGTSFDLGCSAT
ncbi:hypothetical protein A2U01_0109662, partial [Trifolium medium]|nr:hypothetical protein [Trifolium medium]